MSIRGLVLSDLRARGLYVRPTELRPSAADRSVLWDRISDAPMSTEHACSRFLTPFLAKHETISVFGEHGKREIPLGGWAAFFDGDVLVRSGLDDVFDSLDPRYAVYCVKHEHSPRGTVKMDGQTQSAYSRKNWSSVMVFNCDHPANSPVADSARLANTLPGRDLHRLCWLDDSEIGELDPSLNYLVGETSPRLVPDPRIVHFTLGPPDMRGYEDCEYADEWRAERDRWAGEVQ